MNFLICLTTIVLFNSLKDGCFCGHDMQELVRCEARKQQGAFSLVLLLAFGLLGIVLGYIVKK